MDSQPDDEKRMTTDEARQYLESMGITLSNNTLNIWRHQQKGPNYIKVGYRVYYTKKLIDEYLKRCLVEPVQEQIKERSK